MEVWRVRAIWGWGLCRRRGFEVEERGGGWWGAFFGIAFGVSG